MKKLLTAVAFAASIVLPLESANAVPLMTITSPAQLDFSGDFVYAVNFAGSGSNTIGDATFTNVSSAGAGAPGGVSVSGFNQDLPWGGATNLGATPAANTLESVMSTIIWSSGLNPGLINAAVTVGTAYKLQLLFSEGCCDNRHFDVKAEGTQLAEIAGTLVGGSIWQTSTTQGYALTWDFVATDNQLNIEFLRHNPGDTNYLVSGFTLERTSRVPEPASILLAGLGLLAAAASRRRKSR
jgi:hypothetical protein